METYQTHIKLLMNICQNFEDSIIITWEIHDQMGTIANCKEADELKYALQY